MADDSVFSELLKLQAYSAGNVDRVILPYEERGASIGVVRPGAATTPITVQPFKAILGTRVVSNVAPTPPPPAGQGNPVLTSGAEQAYRDIRSATFATPLGTSAGFGYKMPATLFPTNGSGNPRWDLIYATVYVDQPNAITSVIVKPTTSGVPGPQAASPTLLTSVGIPPSAITGPNPAISVVTGATGASPVVPALPADNPSAGIYNIALAAVLVPSSYVSGTSTFPTNQIQIVAPIGDLAETLGAKITRPLSAFTGLNATTYAAASGLWGAVNHRPGEVSPPTRKGGISTQFFLDARNASGSAPLGNGAVLDNSLDWRNRRFRCQAYADSAGNQFASNPTGSAPFVPYVGQQFIAPNFAVVQPFIVLADVTGGGVTVLLSGGGTFFSPLHGKTYYVQLSNLPQGGTLNEVTFYLTCLSGNNDGSGTFQLVKFNPATNTATNLGSVVSPPTGTLANVAFNVPAAPLSEVIDNTTYHYFVKVTGQTGSLDFSNVSTPTAFGSGPTQTFPMNAVSRGQSFHDDSALFTGSLIGSGAGFAAYFSPLYGLTQMGAGSGIGLYVDLATGNLKLFYVGTPGVRMDIDIEATGHFGNF